MKAKEEKFFDPDRMTTEQVMDRDNESYKRSIKEFNRDTKVAHKTIAAFKTAEKLFLDIKKRVRIAGVEDE